MKNIGDRIRDRRRSLGITVEGLAKELGKNRATIYRYENSDIENLPLPILEPLAKALRTTPAYLMGWVTKPSPLLLSSIDSEAHADGCDYTQEDKVACINELPNIIKKLQLKYNFTETFPANIRLKLLNSLIDLKMRYGDSLTVRNIIDFCNKTPDVGFIKLILKLLIDFLNETPQADDSELFMLTRMVEEEFEEADKNEITETLRFLIKQRRKTRNHGSQT